MAVLSALGPLATAQLAPHITLTNGKITTDVFLPDPQKGFYRGTRFEWGGVIGNFTFSGHKYYNPWFTRMESGIQDFVFRGDEIVAGEASAITGPAEEFVSDEGALNYASAPVGGTFIKIGIGVLRKPAEEKYNRYRLYDIVNGGDWTVEQHKDWVSVTQRLIDKTSGVAYEYRKTIRLVVGQPKMRIEHVLKNIGDQDIETRVYDHNFLALDGLTTGPDYRITLPFHIEPKRPVDAALGGVDGNSIVYKKPIQGEERFTVAIGGYGATADDYNVTIQNSKVNAGLNIRGDHPLQSALLWSIRSVLAVEPYIKLSIPKGTQQFWAYEYTYFANGQKPKE